MQKEAGRFWIMPPFFPLDTRCEPIFDLMNNPSMLMAI